MKEKMIEIFPDKKDGKFGEFENNLVFTDGATMREFYEHIIPTLFWKNEYGKHRDRVYVIIPNNKVRK